MTDKERNEINPKLCAEGLRYIVQKYNLDHAETSAVVGEIALLRDSNDDYVYQPSDANWKKQIVK